MSVSKLRESTEKKGCMIAVWVVMVMTALGVAGSGFMGCFNSRAGTEESAYLETPVLVVDGKEATLGQITSQVEGFMSQIGGSSDPDLDFQITASILSNVINQQIMANMASARGVVIDEDTIMRHKSDEIDASIRQYRLDAVTQADLKENATEAEFQKYFEEKVGESIPARKDRILGEVREQLKDPATMRGEVDRYSMQALQESFFNSAKVSDDEIKESYTSYMLQSISFDKQDRSVAEREADANNALKELDSGANFLAVQKKYMTNPVKDPAKFNLRDLKNNPTQKPLADLKVGQHSKVITEFGIPRIYELNAIKSDLPTDFEANKVVYGDTVRRDKGSKDLDMAVAAARQKAKIVWKSPGYEAIYKVSQVRMEDTLSEAEQKARLKEFVTSPVDTTTDVAGPRPGILARYGAWRMLEKIVTADERKALADDIVLVLLDVLTQYEHVPLRLELVDHYVSLGDKSKAAEQLRMAAENNSGYEEANTNTFAQINVKLQELESKGMIGDPEANSIRAVLADWSLKKKEAEDLEKKAQEELDKFAIDPKTGKPITESAKETADKALKEANKPDTKGGTTGQGN